MAFPTAITGFIANTQVNRYVSQPFLSSAENVYIFGRHTSTTSLVRAFKATDPTDSFSNVGTDFNLTGSEAIAGLVATQLDDVIHIVTAQGTVTSFDLYYHTFNMATDAWVITNEAIFTGITVNSADVGHMDIAVRSDGDVIVGYNGPIEVVSASNKSRTYYARREGGTWTIDVSIYDLSGVNNNAYVNGLVAGASDRMHFFYVNFSLIDAFQRTLTSANSLEAEQAAYDTAIDTVHSHGLQQGTSYVSGSTTKVRFPGYDNTAATINCVKLDSGDTPTTTQDDDITGATLVRDSTSYYVSSFAAVGTTLWHIFADNTDLNMFQQSNADEAGWGSTSTFLDHASTISSLKTRAYVRGGNNVIGIVFYAGGVHYTEKDLGAASTNAFDMDAAAALTWNSASTAASNLDADAAATLTWNSASITIEAAAFSSTAVAVLTWNGATLAYADWTSTATADLQWVGESSALSASAWSATAAATVTFNGAATASSNLDSDAAAALTWNSTSEATAAWSSTATASVTWEGVAQSPDVSDGAFDADAAATLAWGGVTIASGYIDTDIDAFASLRMTGASERSAAWSAAATATLTVAGVEVTAAAWSAAAVATITFTGQEAGGAGAFDMDAAASVSWGGADASASAGVSAIDLNGWRVKADMARELEELEEEDILTMLSAAVAYMEQCNGYY